MKDLKDDKRERLVKEVMHSVRKSRPKQDKPRPSLEKWIWHTWHGASTV